MLRQTLPSQLRQPRMQQLTLPLPLLGLLPLGTKLVLAGLLSVSQHHCCSYLHKQQGWTYTLRPLMLYCMFLTVQCCCHSHSRSQD